MSHPSLLCMLSFCWSFCCLGLNGLLQPELVLEWLCVVIRHVIVKVPVHAAFMHAYAAGLHPDCDLPPDHPILQEFSCYPHTVLYKTLYAPQVFFMGVELVTAETGCECHLWDPQLVRCIAQCITTYTECALYNNESGRPPSRKLIIAKFTTPALDSARIGRILRDCQPHIPAHYRETAGQPLLVFKYDRPIGRQWINTKKYADLPKEAMTIICRADCNCHLIPEHFKKDGHLLTTSPDLCPA